MRKFLTLTLVFASFFFGVNAQQHDLDKGRTEKISQMQKNEQQNDFKKERAEKLSQMQKQKQEESTKLLMGTPTTATKAIECMPEATYSNVPTDFTTGVTSNTDAGYIVAQQIEGFEHPVGAIRFFGIQGFHDGSSFNPMNDVDPFGFEINFYEDDAGTPGTLISTETVSLNHVNTDVTFADVYHVFHWDYTPTSPITGLTETFWVGIANTNTDAWFLWIDTQTGSGSGAQYDIAAGTWGVTDYPCGICLVPVLAEPGAPAAPTNFVVTPGASGALEASIDWINPALTFGGETLTELTSVSLWVNDEATAEYENNTPDIGGPETYTYTAAASGLYKFTVYGTNSVGDGEKINQTVWVGEDAPGAPQNVVLTAIADGGEVTWEAPTEGINGGYINPANTTYTVIRMPETIVAENIAGTEYTDIFNPSIGNYQYKVIASNSVGEGGAALSNTALLGAEGIVFYEAFDGIDEGSIPAGWTIEGFTDASWTVQNTSNAGGVAPEMRLYWNPSFEDLTRLVTNSFSVQDNDKLRLKLKHYLNNFAVSGNTLAIQVSFDDGEWTNLWEEELTSDIGPMDMELYIDIPTGTAEMRLGWEFNGDSYDINNYNFDDVVVEPVKGNDLAAISIAGNSTPTVGEVSTYTVTIQNAGTESQSDYTVRLMREGGVELASAPGLPINFTETIDFQIDWTPAAEDEGAVVFYGEVELTGDEVLGNNQTDNLTLDVQPAGTFVATIGTGTTLPSVRIPFDFFWRNSFAQTLYFPSEIGLGGGALTAVSYTNNFTSNLTDMPIKVWVGETDVTDLSDGWVDPTTLTLVYDGTMDFPSGENTIYIPFDMPYVYTGGNLVIYTNRVWEDDYHSSSDKFYGTEDAGSTRTYRLSRDGTEGLDPMNPGSGSTSDWHPNTALFFSTAGLGALEGTVTDGTDPIEAVEVSILGTMAKATTDVNGQYAFPYLLPETYSVQFEKFGYITHTEEGVIIAEDATETVNVALDAIPTFTVTGVAKGNDEVLLEGATVTLMGYSDHNATTDVDGVFTIENVYEGTYELAIALQGYEGYSDATLEVNSTTAPSGVLDLGILTLAEIIVEPFGLMVDVNNVEQSAEFTWNNAFEFFDDFESYDDFAMEFSPWTLVDVDGLATYGFSGITFPNSGSAMAGIIFNPTATNPVMTTSLAYSGDKYVAVFNPESGVACDDWIISPKTTIMPNGQVSFWARGGNALYSAEKFQVAVSTTDATPASFTTISPIVTCPANSDEWVQYTYSLSDYSGQEVYVGIHVTSEDQFYFCLDDFTIGAAKARAFVGYNVYLDDLETPVTTTPIEETTYLFEGLAVGTHTAGVEAVYTTGTTEIVTVDFEVKPIYTVTLTVVDAETDSPVEGATFILDEDEQTTDANGVVTYALINGTYAYTITKDGYIDAAGEIAVDGADVTQTITLDPAHTVTLTVVEEDTTPIEGATVIFNEGEGLTTDAAGKVVIGDLVNGTYSYTVSKFDYTEVTGEIAVAGGDVEETVTLVDAILTPENLDVVVDGTNATFTYEVSGEGGGGGGEGFTESFEEDFPPAGWTLDNTNATTTWVQAETVTFTSGDIVPIDGAYQAFLMWEYSGQNEWLITPSFTVPTGANLTFWSYTGAFGSTNGDHYYAKISTDDGTTWTALWDAVESAGSDYEEVTIDLTAYQGQDVMLAWQGVDGDGQGLWFSWFIDYITVGNAKEAVSFDGELKFASNVSSSSSVVSDRPFSRDGSVVAVSNKSTKAFVGHTIYLDDMETPYDEGVAGYSYDFTGLTVGTHTAGVQRVYTTGASDVVSIDFKVGHTVTFTVKDDEANTIEGITISINDVELTTDAEGVATIELLDGTYDYTASHDYAYYQATGTVVVDGADWDEPVTMIPTGIDSELFSNLKVYPNPFSNKISITHADRVNRVIITNVVGQRVMDITLNGNKEIGTSELGSGIYLITLEGLNGERIVRKMIKR